MIISKKNKFLTLSTLTTLSALSPMVASAEESRTGHVDTYVEHQELDNAIENASSAGVTVAQEDTKVLTSHNADDAKQIVKTAEDYYKNKTAEINKVTSDYKIALANYESEVSRNKTNADNANAKMNALMSNATGGGQTVEMTTKQFVSDEDVKADEQAISRQIEAGRKLNDLSAEIDTYNIAQNAMTLFQTQASQGNIKLQRQTVKISNKGDSERYLTEIRSKYSELQEYVKRTNAQSGSIAEDQKPTFTLYDIVIEDSVKTEGLKPVQIYNYTPIPVTKPVTPTVTYYFYDLRNELSSDRVVKNKDNETIVEASKDSSNGKKVVQAMVNQTVGLETNNQPLPSNRIGKFHDLEVTTHLPENGKFLEELTNVDSENWTYTYNEKQNTVTFKATAKYLVEINKNRALNNSGSIGEFTEGEFPYSSPKVYFKLMKDDTTYQTYSETIVNHEYAIRGETVTIRTDSAHPTKHNFNSRLTQIDGRPVLPGSINNYEVKVQNSQYKGVNIDREMQEIGQDVIDDFPEEAVDLKGPFEMIDDNGNVLYRADVKDGQTSGSFNATGNGKLNITWSMIDDNSKPEGFTSKINGKAVRFHINGHDNEYYKTYVEGGRDVKFRIPMVTKKIDNTPDKKGGTYNGNSYTNVAYQSDFGNVYKTNEVTNTAPLIDPRKDAVLSFADLTSLDINANKQAEIEHGSLFMYRYKSSRLPKGLSEPITSVSVVENFNNKADEYQGRFIGESGTPFKFKEGTALYNRYRSTKGIMPANTDISKYITQVIDRNVSKDVNTNTQVVNGADKSITRVKFMFDEDFISQIDFDNTEFQYDLFFETKRIADIDNVTNTVDEVINNIDFGSNETITNTSRNQIDRLKDEVAKVNKRVDENDASDKKFREETISALSVVIKTMNDNKTEATKGIAEAKENTKKLAEKVSANTDAIKKNTDAIEVNKKDIRLTKDQLEIIKSGIADLLKRVDQAYSTMEIHDASVKTDADALLYATNHGIAAGSIKSIGLNSDKSHYVVTYNTSKTGINNTTPAREPKLPTTQPTVTSNKPTTQPTVTSNKPTTPVTVTSNKPTTQPNVASNNTTLKVVGKRTYSFYSLKTDADVRKELVRLGNDEKSIVSIKKVGDAIVAEVNVYEKKHV